MAKVFLRVRLLSVVLLMSVALQAAGASETESSEDPTAEELLEVELRGVIASWASAWQSQLDDVYLLHYHEDFKPEGFANREDWINNRRERIRDSGDINIGLDDFVLVVHDDDTALVRFWQHYSRPGYADDTHKEMLLQKQGQIWRIASEHNIEVAKQNAP